MKRKAIIAMSIIAGIIALWIILKLIPFNDIIYTFSHSSLKIVAAYITASIGIMLALTLRWRIVLRSKGLKVPFLQLLSYRIISYGIGFMTPTAKLGGEPVRAALLGRHKIGFKKALSTVFIDKTVETTSSSTFFFIGVVTLLVSLAIPLETGLILLVLATIFLTGITIFYYRMLSGRSVVVPMIKMFRIHKIKHFDLTEKKMLEFEHTITVFFQKDKKRFFMAIGFSFLSWVLMFAEFKLALLMLGIDATISQIFLVICFIGAAVMIPVPFAIGTLEAGQIVAFSIINLQSAAAVALAFLVRARDLIWSAIGMLLLSYYGVRISQTIKKEYEKEYEKD